MVGLNRCRMLSFWIGVAVIVALTSTGVAYAGADATFTPLSALVTGWMQGSLGTLLALVGAVMGIAQGIQGRWGGLVAGFGIAAAAFYVPNIIPTITTGLI